MPKNSRKILKTLTLTKILFLYIKKLQQDNSSIYKINAPLKKTVTYICVTPTNIPVR